MTLNSALNLGLEYNIKCTTFYNMTLNLILNLGLIYNNIMTELSLNTAYCYGPKHLFYLHYIIYIICYIIYILYDIIIKSKFEKSLIKMGLNPNESQCYDKYYD